MANTPKDIQKNAEIVCAEDGRGVRVREVFTIESRSTVSVEFPKPRNLNDASWHQILGEVELKLRAIQGVETVVLHLAP